MTRYRHVALLVGDLRAAEEFYTAVFDMEVLFREGPLEAGGPEAVRWATLPAGASWEDAETASIEIGMVALGRNDFVLTLFAMEPTGVQTYAIGLVMDLEAMATVRSRLPDDAIVESDRTGWLAFVDRFGVRWQLSDTQPLASAGQRNGTWLQVERH